MPYYVPAPSSKPAAAALAWLGLVAAMSWLLAGRRQGRLRRGLLAWGAVVCLSLWPLLESGAVSAGDPEPSRFAFAATMLAAAALAEALDAARRIRVLLKARRGA